MKGCPFSDVIAGNYYEKAITWAADYKITNGCRNGQFNPDDEVTREQLATLLCRYTRYKGYALGETADLSGFSDVNGISDWAK